MRCTVGAVVGAVCILLASTEMMAERCPCPTVDEAEAIKRADAISIGKSLSATTDSSAPVRDGAGGWRDAVGGGAVQTRLTFDVQTVMARSLCRRRTETSA
jgi:hypothetical protein